MSIVAETLAQAKRCHMAGQLQEAEQLYLEVLRADSANVEALNLLGVVFGTQGKSEAAANCFQRVVELQPNIAEGYFNLGNALARQSCMDAAVECFRRALKLNPDLVEAHNNLGVILKRQGDFDAAAICHRRVLELKPNSADAHNNLGVVLERLGNLDEAAECFRRVLELNPGFAPAHNNLGVVLEKQGNLEAAAASYRQTIVINPDFAEAHNNLGVVLEKQGCFEAAAECCRRALQINPDFVEAHNNLGNALRGQGCIDAAAICHRRAVELNPDYAEGHVNLSLSLLRMGSFAEGWREYEWRHKRDDTLWGVLPQPRWTGSTLGDRTILLRCEQGLGDTLQFVRFAESLKQQGATVIVECPAVLATLLKSCPGVDRVVVQGEGIPPFDVHLPMLSLPFMLGTSLETIPARIPYLWPAADLVQRWHDELGQETALKVGIAWQGRTANRMDRVRSIPLAQFVPLVDVPGVRLYSLQMGTGREQLVETADRWPIMDLGDRLGDFHNTAAVVSNLDLVITCDSAPAHLAGSLGIPVWVALPFAADWRWLLDRDDSPWYPTMRLFRQAHPGDWQGVFQRIHDALVEFQRHTGCQSQNGRQGEQDKA